MKMCFEVWKLPPKCCMCCISNACQCLVGFPCKLGHWLRMSELYFGGLYDFSKSIYVIKDFSVIRGLMLLQVGMM